MRLALNDSCLTIPPQSYRLSLVAALQPPHRAPERGKQMTHRDAHAVHHSQDRYGSLETIQSASSEGGPVAPLALGRTDSPVRQTRIGLMASRGLRKIIIGTAWMCPSQGMGVRRISKIAHLAWALHPGIPLGRIDMAFVTSYFDASGHHGGPHSVTVGGFLGDVGAWNRFDPIWTKTLRGHGITVPFRMTSFISGKEGFERFKDKPDLQAKVLRDLIKIVSRHSRVSFATTVLAEDWNVVNQQYRLKECHCTPYAIAAFAVIAKCDWWAYKKKLNRTEYVFEEGDAGREDLEWLVRNVPDGLKAVRPRFDSKALTPLQPADLAVWEHRCAIRDRLDDDEAPFVYRNLRPSLRQRPHMWGVMDREKIRQWVIHLVGVPKRSDASWNRRTWKPFLPWLQRERVGDLP